MSPGEQQAALERARQGNTEALQTLLASFRPYVLVLTQALWIKRLQARLDHSDLAQDALLEAYRSFSAFRGTTVAELVAWLRALVLRTAGHTIRGHLETGKRDVTREQGGNGPLEWAADPGSSPSAQAIQHEQAARMAQTLARLPEDMQQVLLGRHMDSLSYADLARKLNRTEGAVRVLYTRALRRLRDELRE
jgi:RNA polymerase sigma-70 factor (ECF subfamily)